MRYFTFLFISYISPRYLSKLFEAEYASLSIYYCRTLTASIKALQNIYNSFEIQALKKVQCSFMESKKRTAIQHD